MKYVWSVLYLAFIFSACHSNQSERQSARQENKCTVETDRWVYQGCSEYSVVSNGGMSESLWFSCKGVGDIKATQVLAFNCKKWRQL